jgi:hypothetical protein
MIPALIDRSGGILPPISLSTGRQDAASTVY